MAAKSTSAYSWIAIVIVAFFAVFFFRFIALAAAPSGNNWFQLLASPFTGGDNTGDGGTGNPADLNYYYVGQTFTANTQIKSTGTTAANIWIDYNTALVNATNLVVGTYFPSWAGQVISGGRIKSTGYRTSGTSSGTGNFGSQQFTALQPTEANYGTGSPATLTINVGTIGETLESNISLNGDDILDSKEDFNFHIWADTVKPYAGNPSPVSGANNTPVDSNFSFDLRDAKLPEPSTVGVGTGVDTASPAASVTVDDGSSVVQRVNTVSYSCSGTWGTNLCHAAVNLPAQTAFAGDTRRLKYATTYTLILSGWRDRASSNQSQLGDSNGPNIMDPKTYTFTTEGDTVPPRVVSESPARGSGGNNFATPITITVHDKKTYPGSISGTGLVSSSCRINVSSASFPLTTYQSGSVGVTTTAVDYGARFTIVPATPFGQNETVSVSVYNCEDAVGNVMVTDNYVFYTADDTAPFVDTVLPVNDQIVSPTSNVSFHVKDTGLGVDLNSVVVYVNGMYYTNTGGAGSITTSGTDLSFASSLNFHGANYAGDTTAVTGSANDYMITIDPQTDFAEGESVPVIVYAKDLSGNLMKPYIYGLTITTTVPPVPGSTYCGSNTIWNGSACVGASGSSFCGSNTTWNGTTCVGTGGGSGGDNGGGNTCVATGSSGGANGLILVAPKIFGTSVNQIDDNSVLVSWFTTYMGDSAIAYGSESDALASGKVVTIKNDLSNGSFHTVTITGLRSGQVYYFWPQSWIQGRKIIGDMVSYSLRVAVSCPVVTMPIVPEKGGNTKVSTQESAAKNDSVHVNPISGAVNNTTDLNIGDSIAGASDLQNIGASDVQGSYVDTLLNSSAKTTKAPLGDIVSWITVIGLALLVMTFAALNYRYQYLLGREASDEGYSYPHGAMLLFIGTAVLCVITVLYVWSMRCSVSDQPALLDVSAPQILSVSGQVKNPETNMPYAAVDLTSGHDKYSIRTDAQGMFSLSQVFSNEGVRINQPDLKRAFVWVPANGTLNTTLWFSPDLFNAISDTTEAMMRQRPDIAYGMFSADEQKVVNLSDFANTFPHMNQSSEIRFTNLEQVKTAGGPADPVFVVTLANGDAKPVTWKYRYANKHWYLTR